MFGTNFSLFTTSTNSSTPTTTVSTSSLSSSNSLPSLTPAAISQVKKKEVIHHVMEDLDFSPPSTPNMSSSSCSFNNNHYSSQPWQDNSNKKEIYSKANPSYSSSSMNHQEVMMGKSPIGDDIETMSSLGRSEEGLTHIPSFFSVGEIVKEDWIWRKGSLKV